MANSIHQFRGGTYDRSEVIDAKRKAVTTEGTDVSHDSIAVEKGVTIETIKIRIASRLTILIDRRGNASELTKKQTTKGTKKSDFASHTVKQGWVINTSDNNTARNETVVVYAGWPSGLDVPAVEGGEVGQLALTV